MANDEESFIKFIDSTLIINKSGIECVGFGSETKKKKFTKLSVLSDSNQNCDAIIAHNTHKKEISFEKKLVIVNNNLPKDHKIIFLINSLMK